jgi:hypothetical protein
MPDIGIATIEVCLKALEELPHEDAMAAINYISQRLRIKEDKRRAQEAQRQKLGREPTDDEVTSALDEWDEPEATSAAYPPATPVTTLGLKRAI